MLGILISRDHEWREKVTCHPVPPYRIERHGGTVKCIDCGHEKPVGVRSYVPCHRKVEQPSSGYSGVLLRDGEYVGRFRMCGKHPVTDRPFAQWSFAP